MQRKPGFPVTNCNIKMPEMLNALPCEPQVSDDEGEQQRRQQLINFGHSQWGFNNWSWSVLKQDLDFVDFSNGKYCAGVVAFVSIKVKKLDIHRENIGYATSIAANKGFAIYKSRKGAVTNGLRETLLSFGGSVATDLMELLDPRVEPTLVPVSEPELPAPVPLAAKDPPIKPCPPRPALNVKPNPPPVAKAQPMPNVVLPRAPMPRPHVPHVGPHPTPGAPHVGPHPTPGAPHVAPHVSPVAPHVPPHVSPGAPHGVPHVPTLPPAPPAAPLRPNSNEVLKTDVDAAEEEARAERKRRQRQAQEEFRQRQVLKEKGLDEKQDLQRNTSSFDKLLMEIHTQDIVIQETGDSVVDTAKRKSPGPEASTAKRRASVINKLDIVKAD